MGKQVGQIIGGIIVVVVGGFILAWLIGDARFSNSRQETSLAPAASFGQQESPVQVTQTPLPTYTPYPTPTTALVETVPTAVVPAEVVPTEVVPIEAPPQSWAPEWYKFGDTVRGEALHVVKYGSGEHEVILLGGLHAGFAPATVAISEGLVTYFEENPDQVPQNVTVYIIPSLNKDSRNDPGEWAGRANANGVDLNRNWDCDWTQDATWRSITMEGSGGSSAFSEPETRALRDLILQVNPDVVVIWGALVRDGLIAPGQCGRATDTTRMAYALAGVFGSASGYPVNDYEAVADQVINGDITNWLDKVGIPSFFVLLDDYLDPDWRNNLEGVRALLAYYES